MTNEISPSERSVLSRLMSCILYQVDLSPSICCKAIQEQRSALKNPVVDVETLLTILQKQQLPQTVSRLCDETGFL